MKKRIIGLLAIIALVLGIAGTLIACTEEKAEYSVTVLSPSGNPVEDVSVSWMSGSKETGSATTNADGKATAQLPLGNYTVELSGYGEGFTYTPANLTATNRSITMKLRVQEVEYSVTVQDEDGKPFKNVTVTWRNQSNNAFAGDKKTDENGKAAITLDHGDYNVTVTPPDGYTCAPQSVTGENPSASFTLLPIENGVTFTVTVKSEGGLLFSKRYDPKGDPIISNYWATVLLYDTNGDIVDLKETDEEGKCTFIVEAGTYTAGISADRIPAGYAIPDEVTLTEGEPDATIVLESTILEGELDLTAENARSYWVGDIIHDYSFKTAYEIDGKIWEKSISQLFEDGKEVVIINNWGTGCYNCMEEMPLMQQAYAEYKEKVEIIAVNNYKTQRPDTDDDIKYCVENYNWEFPMMLDTHNFTRKFNIQGWPTTIVIDRYGAIAHIEVGSITSKEAWVRLMTDFIGEGYVQNFVPGYISTSYNDSREKPDIQLPNDHYESMAAAMNTSDTFHEAGAEIVWEGYTDANADYIWPFLYADQNTHSEILNEFGSDVPILYTSNRGKANSIAILKAQVKVNKGMVLTFDYYSDTELGADVFFIFWNGRQIGTISGNSYGWKVCYLYCEIENLPAGSAHTLEFYFIKDSNDDHFSGKDGVFIRNIRFIDFKNAEKNQELLEYLETDSLDMLRSAAYGPTTADGHFTNYVDVVLNPDDGYYYVDLTGLTGDDAALWGSDKKPMLFANLGSPTLWQNNATLINLFGGVDEDDKYIYNTEFDLGDGVKRDYRDDLYDYAVATDASLIPYCVPVDEMLQKLLVAFMNEYRRKYLEENPGTTWPTSENEWLEVCCFYSHFGKGEVIGNPIEGVLDKTAIKIEAGKTYTADLTREMAPYPKVRYKFTPATSGVYKFQSLISDEDADDYSAQMWLYDASSIELARSYRGVEGKSSDTLDYAIYYNGNMRRHYANKNMQNFDEYYYLEADHEYYLAVAFLMPTLLIGKFDFKITYEGTEVKEKYAACSDDIYEMDLDKDGNILTTYHLSGAVDYEYDAQEDRYYALNASGGRASKIYLDTKYVCTNAIYIPLSELVDKKVTADKTPLFGYFDFSQCDVYFDNKDVGEGYAEVDYLGVIDLSDVNEKYKDYTDIFKGYIAAAEDNDGLIEVNQEIVKILTLFFELRGQIIFYNGDIDDWDEEDPPVYDVVAGIESALKNEWLRFCWYEKTHNAANP